MGRYQWRDLKQEGEHLTKGLFDVEDSERVVLKSESCIDGYSAYWPTAVTMPDFIGYLNELERKGFLEIDPIGVDCVHVDLVDKEEEWVQESFSTVQAAINYVKGRQERIGNFLRVNSHKRDYMWDKLETIKASGFEPPIIGIINSDGTDAANIVALLELTAKLDIEEVRQAFAEFAQPLALKE